MEQMYLIEIFIDKVTIFASESDEQSGANKNLIIKIKFGPKVQFIIKEGQLALNEDKKDDIMECDEHGRRKWTRTIRVGKSYLFPSYSDTVLMILSKFPLEIEVWNDDENEVEIFVGLGTMHWETEFFHMLKETADAGKLHEPLTIKQRTPLFAECCCRQCGEIAFILRVSALGDSIITEFQQLMKDPEAFVFRTNKAPSMFQCKRIEGDDPNFCMVGSLYETTTLEDPDIVNNAQKTIEVCTELQSCGVAQRDGDYSCEHGGDGNREPQKTYPIDKIRMGDITGPCGNTNCPLAHKVRNYLRNLETYKEEAAKSVKGTKGESSRKICGKCDCKDDRYHRDDCPEKQAKHGKDGKAVCSGCGGVTQAGETCKDRQKKLEQANISYFLNTNAVFESMFSKNYTVHNVNEINYNFQNLYNQYQATTSHVNSTGVCSCPKPQMSSMQTQVTHTSSSPCIRLPESKASSRSIGVNNPMVYNINVRGSGRKVAVYNCTEIPDDKDCKCDPPKPKPPCKAFDCECVTETSNIAARKAHRPYCPSFKHKSNCPVTAKMHEDEEKKRVDDDEDETEPLPYGLPPIELGPCPVMGRPCTVPDGYARMYKTAALPPQPPSYSDAGKVCCSKEYERIKKAIKEYMKHEKDNDLRCINRFNVDTERRCCDKEQKLMSLTGKACCGSHKMEIHEKFKKKDEEKK